MKNTSSQPCILILGASSEGGVGWVSAEYFASRGWQVIVAARRLEALEILAGRCKGLALQVDISDETSVLQLAKRLGEEKVAISAILNAAGNPQTGSIESVTSEQMHHNTELEYYGNWYLFKHLAPLVADHGAIVCISSLSTTHIVPGFVAYAAAKAASNTLLRYAAIELAPRQIRVNGILPGLIDTPMNDSFRRNPALLEVMFKEVPFGRMASPQEIASAAAWLCQPDCFMTGCLLAVDGGNHLRRAPFPEELPATAFTEVGSG